MKHEMDIIRREPEEWINREAPADACRRRALMLAVAAPLALAGCAGGRTIPIPDDADAFFADVESAIASAEALVNAAAGWGVGPDTIAAARGLIAKARGYLADARAALGTGAWKDLANLALRVLTGIVFSGGLGVLEDGRPAPLAMTVRK